MTLKHYRLFRDYVQIFTSTELVFKQQTCIHFQFWQHVYKYFHKRWRWQWPVCEDLWVCVSLCEGQKVCSQFCLCECVCVCVSGVSWGHNDTVWKNSVLCLPLSYFSSSALPTSKFHWCVHRDPDPAIIGNTASLFHIPPHFSLLIQNIWVPVWSFNFRFCILEKRYMRFAYLSA